MASNSLDQTSRDLLTKAWGAIDSAPADAQLVAGRMLTAAPSDAEAALLLAAAHRRQGDAGAARRRLGPLMTDRTASPVAWFEWGQILAETGDDEAAVEALRRAVALAPEFIGAARALGDQLVALGRAEEAGRAYATAARTAANAQGLATAAAALAEGRAAEAEALLKAHMRRSPGDLRAAWLLAEAAMRVGRVVEAEAVLNHCLEAAPGFAEARHTLAILLYLQHRFADAAGHMKLLLDLLPHQPGLRILLATCLRDTGDHEAALKLYEQMLAACPTRHAILLVYGHSLKALGRDAEAEAAYRACLKLAPGWAPSLYLSLADIKTLPLTDADLDAMRRPNANMSDFGRAQLGYAIGHTLDQRGDYAGAFAAFAGAAALRRRAISYDADETSAFVQAAKAAFTPALFAARAASGCPSAAPVLIVGLPRAGSTLVEQILASHSQVEGTSELKEIGLMAAALLGGRPLAELPGIIATLDTATLAALGARYVANTRQFRRLGRELFIDKMPGNVWHIGLIHLILPNARIIDVRRAPMASGFAAFRQFFQLDQSFADFSYDLRDIGRYYRDYVELTAHVDTVLPGRVLRLRYEDLIADTEQQVRRLLDHCGLPFEPACLRHWETARPVQTPSAQQVRRPITNEGLTHWRHYEPWLGALRDALGDLADPAPYDGS